MSKIILDFGSGNTCRNDKKIVERMIDELEKIDTHKHEIIIKWQLFEKAGENIPLDKNSFYYAAGYALGAGYKTTASIFDLNSLKNLLELDFDIPFVKIANRRDLDWLIGEVPRKIPVYISVGNMSEGESLLYGQPAGHIHEIRDTALFCVSQYPASIEEYERKFSKGSLKHGISDHTIGLDLYKKYQPRIWEKHYKLFDSTGLDAGPFAITPEELKEIL
jgi:sialic acid synthase SpsE